VHTPAAYDWIELVAVRFGSGLLVWGDSQRTRFTRDGDVWLAAPNTPFGLRPDGCITVTRLFVAVRFIVEQIRWQTWPPVPDQVTARVIARERVGPRLQVVRVDNQLDRLLLALDALAETTVEQRIREDYFDAAATALSALAIVIPQARGLRPAGLSPAEAALAKRASQACMSVVRPLRDEVREARALIEARYAEPLPLDSLAAQVNLSRAQFHRVFTDQMGKTPLAYRDSIRVQAMVRLLLESDADSREIARLVGWTDAGTAAKVFHRAVGVYPEAYRDSLTAVAQGTRPADRLMSADDLLVFRH
jgi:AraC-like DNA-binding protein